MACLQNPIQISWNSNIVEVFTILPMVLSLCQPEVVELQAEPEVEVHTTRRSKFVVVLQHSTLVLQCCDTTTKHYNTQP